MATVCTTINACDQFDRALALHVHHFLKTFSGAADDKVDVLSGRDLLGHLIVQHLGQDRRLVMCEAALFKPAHHSRHVRRPLLSSNAPDNSTTH
jgi:hypothetical protein